MIYDVRSKSDRTLRQNRLARDGFRKLLRERYEKGVITANSSWEEEKEAIKDDSR